MFKGYLAFYLLNILISFASSEIIQDNKDGLINSAGSDDGSDGGALLKEEGNANVAIQDVGGDQDGIPVTTYAIIDGTIRRISDTDASVDHIPFDLEEDGYVEIDILSMESKFMAPPYIDLNKDCDASYIDPVIHLFKSDGSGILHIEDYIKGNDDVLYGPNGTADGSISLSDSFLGLYLAAGSYVVAISRYPLSVASAIANRATDGTSTSSPYLCGDASNSYHGNYRTTFRGTSKIYATSPNTYLGNQCLNRFGSDHFGGCGYHKRPIPYVPRYGGGSLFGTIWAKDSKLSLDFLRFDMKTVGNVVIDVLSSNTIGLSTPIDILGDCDGSYMDSIVHLFKDNNPLTMDDYITGNDDAVDMNGKIGMQDGSIQVTDSFLHVKNLQGKYLLVIGPFPFVPVDAIQGYVINQKTTLQRCGLPSDHANYIVSFNATIPNFGMIPPNSYIGNKCSINSTTTSLPSKGQ